MKFNNFFKKKSEYNYLELTPFKLKESELGEDGLVNVLIPRFKNKYAIKYFTRNLKSNYIKANLDEFGSETWALIDGKNSVHQIGQQLSEKFGDKIEPVYERLTTFFTNLHRYNFISFLELKKGK
jgi:hypothetical protein